MDFSTVNCCKCLNSMVKVYFLCDFFPSLIFGFGAFGKHLEKCVIGNVQKSNVFGVFVKICWISFIMSNKG